MFTRDLKTQALIDFLTDKVNQQDFAIMTYEDLSTVAGVDVTTDGGRSLLGRARKAVERDQLNKFGKKVLFGTVISEGIKMLTPDEQAEVPSQEVVGVRRRTKQARHRLVRVEYEKLTNEGKQMHNIASAIVQTTLHFTGSSSVKRLQEDERTKGAVLDMKSLAAKFLESM